MVDKLPMHAVDQEFSRFSGDLSSTEMGTDSTVCLELLLFITARLAM